MPYSPRICVGVVLLSVDKRVFDGAAEDGSFACNGTRRSSATTTTPFCSLSSPGLNTARPGFPSSVPPRLPRRAVVQDPGRARGKVRVSGRGEGSRGVGAKESAGGWAGDREENPCGMIGRSSLVVGAGATSLLSVEHVYYVYSLRGSLRDYS